MLINQGDIGKGSEACSHPHASKTFSEQHQSSFKGCCVKRWSSFNMFQGSSGAASVFFRALLKLYDGVLIHVLPVFSSWHQADTHAHAAAAPACFAQHEHAIACHFQ